jgi:hypothetical protein
MRRPVEGVNSHLEIYHRPPAPKGEIYHRAPGPNHVCARRDRRALAHQARLGRRRLGKKGHVGCIKGPPGRRIQCVGERRRFERLALAAVLAALLLASSAPPSGAVVTIGSNLARVPNSSANFSPRPTLSNLSLASDRQAPGGLASPVNGTVVRWGIRVGDSTRLTNLRIVRPMGGGFFTGAGTSASVVPPINATTFYTAHLPIRIGDYIGIDCCSDGAPGAEFFVSGPAIRYEWQPRLADGGAGRPPLNTDLYEVAINAEITSTFAVDVIRRNKKKGTATIAVTVAHAGEVTGAGKGVKVANAAVISKPVSGPGSVQFLIKPKGKKRRKLNSAGKVKVRPKITYTPTGGESVTRSVGVKLIKR